MIHPIFRDILGGVAPKPAQSEPCVICGFPTVKPVDRFAGWPICSEECRERFRAEQDASDNRQSFDDDRDRD